MHLWQHFIDYLLRITQYFSMKLIGTKKNYLTAPNEILSGPRVHNISRLGHLFPSFIFTIITVVYSLPEISDSYARQLENNSATITLIAVVVFLAVLVLNGVVIEKILINTNSSYALYIHGPDESNRLMH